MSRPRTWRDLLSSADCGDTERPRSHSLSAVTNRGCGYASQPAGSQDYDECNGTFLTQGAIARGVVGSFEFPPSFPPTSSSQPAPSGMQNHASRNQTQHRPRGSVTLDQHANESSSYGAKIFVPVHGPVLVPLSLERYATLYEALTKGDGSQEVQPFNILDENKYSRMDMKQVLHIHGLSDAPKQGRREVLMNMVGMRLACPFRVAKSQVSMNHENMSSAECEQHLRCLEWLDAPVVAVDHIVSNRPSPTYNGQAEPATHGPSSCESGKQSQQVRQDEEQRKKEQWQQQHWQVQQQSNLQPQHEDEPMDQQQELFVQQQLKRKKQQQAKAPTDAVCVQASRKPKQIGGMDCGALLGEPGVVVSASLRVPTFEEHSAATQNIQSSSNLRRGGIQATFQGGTPEMNEPNNPATQVFDEVGAARAQEASASGAAGARLTSTTFEEESGSLCQQEVAVSSTSSIPSLQSEVPLLSSSLKLHAEGLEVLCNGGAIKRKDLVLVALLQDIISPPSQGRPSEKVSAGFHVGEVGRQLNNAHDAELCQPGCKDPHHFFMVRLSVDKAKAGRCSQLTSDDRFLEIKVDLHPRNQLTSWKDLEREVMASSRKLEDSWMHVKFLETATQQLPGKKRKRQPSRVESTSANNEEPVFAEGDIVWCLERGMKWPAQVEHGKSSGMVVVELLGSPKIMKEVKSSVLRPFLSLLDSIKTSRHSLGFRQALEEALKLNSGSHEE